MGKHILEPAAQEFADAAAKPPFVYELAPEGARKVLDNVQAGATRTIDVDEKWVVVPAEVGEVPVRIVRPLDSTRALPTILYIHGGGWVLGDAGTHDRLVRGARRGCRRRGRVRRVRPLPEARYPVAIEQAYAAARWITVRYDATVHDFMMLNPPARDRRRRRRRAGDPRPPQGPRPLLALRPERTEK